MGKIYGSALELIGNTPLVEIKNVEKSEGLEATILAKLEYFNPAGSVKDRIGKAMIEDAEQGQWLKARWEEFEAYETPEAKFAHVLDTCQPLFLNDASNGRSWEEHQVKKSQIYKRNRKTGEGSEVIWEYMKELIDKHIALGHVIDDEKDGR